MNNPNTPEFELKPLSALTCINYNLKDANILGAGQYNGQISYFDIRKGSAPVESSRLEHSHRLAIRFGHGSVKEDRIDCMSCDLIAHPWYQFGLVQSTMTTIAKEST